MSKGLLRKFACAGLLSATLATSSWAADPMVENGIDWTGMYVGGHLGIMSGDKDWDRVLGYFGAGPAPGISGYDVDGFLYGAQIGYNYQDGMWVFGVEGEISGTNGGGDDRPRANWFETEVNYIGSLTGRVGVAKDQALVFVETGLAIVNEDHIHNSGGGVIRAEEDRNGFLIGGGLEWAFDDIWSAEIEYNYIQLGDERLTLTNAGGGAIFDIEQDLHTVKFGINMKF